MSGLLRAAGWLLLILIAVPFAIALIFTVIGAATSGQIAGGVLILVGLAAGFVLAASSGAILVGFADLLDDVHKIQANTAATKLTSYRIQSSPHMEATPHSPTKPPRPAPHTSESAQVDLQRSCRECGALVSVSTRDLDRCPHCGAEAPWVAVEPKSNSGKTARIRWEIDAKYCSACETKLIGIQPGGICPGCGATVQ